MLYLLFFMSNIRLLSVLPHRFALSHSLIVEKHLYTQAFVRFKTICISYLKNQKYLTLSYLKKSPVKKVAFSV